MTSTSGDELEALDRARADEARRICAQLNENPVTLAARLTREGWTPPDPLEAEVAAIWGPTEMPGAPVTAVWAKAAIRKALERGIEIGREQSR